MQEKAEPLMPQLQQLLALERPLYAAESAVAQFEVLLSRFGGPKEQLRWKEWSARIKVVQNDSQPSERIQALDASHCMTEVQSFFSILQRQCMRLRTYVAEAIEIT